MTLTAEQRSAQARKAARTRWAMAWRTRDGRQARSAAYSQRIIRAIATGRPQWLIGDDYYRIIRAMNGSSDPEDFL